VGNAGQLLDRDGFTKIFPHPFDGLPDAMTGGAGCIKGAQRIAGGTRESKIMNVSNEKRRSRSNLCRTI